MTSKASGFFVNPAACAPPGTAASTATTQAVARTPYAPPARRSIGSPLAPHRGHAVVRVTASRFSGALGRDRHVVLGRRAPAAAREHHRPVVDRVEAQGLDVARVVLAQLPRLLVALLGEQVERALDVAGREVEERLLVHGRVVEL